MQRSDSTRVRHIFAYGTLMSSATGSMGEAERALLRTFGKCQGKSSIRGMMFDAGACPGVVLGGGARDLMHGEVWRIPADLPDLVEALDRYEGCAAQSPSPHPYARRRVRVRLATGARVTAWIYVWIKSTHGLRRIADGCWRGPSAPRPVGNDVPPMRQPAAA